MVAQQADIAKSGSRIPHSKVTAAGAAGASSIVLVWLIQVAFKVDVPAHVASSLTSLLAVGAGYLKNI
jgi:hypothetical protein